MGIDKDRPQAYNSQALYTNKHVSKRIIFTFPFFEDTYMTCSKTFKVRQVVEAAGCLVDIQKAGAFNGIHPEDRMQVGLAVAKNIEDHYQKRELAQNVDLTVITYIEPRRNELNDAADQEYHPVLLVNAREVYVVTRFVSAGAPYELEGKQYTLLKLGDSNTLF